MMMTRRNRLLLVAIAPLFLAFTFAPAVWSRTHDSAAASNPLAGIAFTADVNGILWRMHFVDDSQLRVHRDNSVVYEARYSVADNQLSLTDRSGSIGCAGPPAVYTFVLEDGRLDLRRRSDPCPATRNVFQSARWEQR